MEAKAQRAVVVLPGLGNNSQDYKAVGEALESRGLHVQVSLPHACQLNISMTHIAVFCLAVVQCSSSPSLLKQLNFPITGGNV